MPSMVYKNKVRVRDKYRIVGFISSGTYGRVYKAVGWNGQTGDFAIKKFKPDKEGEVIQYTGISQSACREMALCSELSHPNVINLVEIILEDKCIFMVFEYAEHDLLQIIQHHTQPARHPIPASAIKSMLFQLLNGLLYLHRNWVLHRDLKPANIMVTSKGEVRIGDLGLARLFYKPLHSLFSGDKVVVTIWYRAPDLLLGSKHYTPAVDLWAVGCIFAELLSLRPIFKGEEAKMDSKKTVPFQRNQVQKIVEVLGMPTKEKWPGLVHQPEFAQLQTVPYPGRDSGSAGPLGLDTWYWNTLRSANYQEGQPSGSPGQQGLDLLTSLLDYDPTKRMTAEEALHHPYFTANGEKVSANCFEGMTTQYPHRRVSQEDNDIRTASLPGTKKNGLPDDTLIGRPTKRLKEIGRGYNLSTSPGPTIYTPPSEDPRQNDALAANAKVASRGPSPLRSVTLEKTSSPYRRGSISSETDSLSKDFDHEGSISGHEEEEEDDMDTRPPLHRPTDGRSQVPLLKDERGRSDVSAQNGSARPTFATRRSTFRSRSPDMAASAATKKKYLYAGFFLLLSLIAFVVQTETASYIQNKLGWQKPYAMLYLTHGSWSILWPAQLLILRLRDFRTPWKAFWRRHVQIVRTTAQMVVSGDQHLTTKEAHSSPIGYMLRKTAIVTIALTVGGASWYYAVGITSNSDLTAIYNCSAFFAYAFSIPILGDKFRIDKALAVLVAIAGVMTIAYGDSKSTGEKKADNRLVGNIVIGIGSVLYGLYEVLYKKLACPPDGVSPGRGAVFANTFGSLIGCFTLLVLWIPLPILHFTGVEVFEWPPGKARWMLFISTFSNAYIVFSGCFLVLISLTSPVLSSIAGLLTIVLVCIADYFRTGEPLSIAAIAGGLLIMGAFFFFSWSTYREMEEERKKQLESDPVFSDDDDDDDE
ncbi:MAG: hypothetical protein L6R36_004858 [Xanthoria steineri]|nr:MAG: hypothetical protein L6R36_004858 [Xanthoria steineri]